MRLATILWMTLVAMLLGWYSLIILGVWIVLCVLWFFGYGWYEERKFKKIREKRGW